APSTVSEHLARLVTSGLLTVRADGRKRYYRLADAEVGALLAAIRALADRLDRR
ncbi:transcriptional regulator, partial [Pseudooceanicola lipolyticus]